MSTPTRAEVVARLNKILDDSKSATYDEKMWVMRDCLALLDAPALSGGEPIANAWLRKEANSELIVEATEDRQRGEAWIAQGHRVVELFKSPPAVSEPAPSQRDASQ